MTIEIKEKLTGSILDIGGGGEAVIGQIKAEILCLHQTFFRAFSRFARSRSCLAMISTSCS